MQWFRLYAEFATDPKVQMMSEVYQRRLVMLFCMRCNDNETLQDSTVVFQLRVTPAEWAETKAQFMALGFIDSSNNVLKWDRRQYKSDSSTERVYKHRATKTTGAVTTPKVKRYSNAPDTDTETETERTKTLAQTPSAKGTRIPETFAVTQEHRQFATEKGYESPDSAIDTFRDYWRSVPGAKGNKLDWDATFRVWLSRTKKPSRASPEFQPPKKLNPNLYREQ